MEAELFDEVWYRSRPNSWWRFRILAYEDIGRLTISDSLVEFRSRKNAFQIHRIRKVSYGKQGRDFINNWVKIEYGNDVSDRVAYFADGSSNGWGGIRGGTKEILEAIRKIPVMESAQSGGN
jgi:hypothetical protein